MGISTTVDKRTKVMFWQVLIYTTWKILGSPGPVFSSPDFEYCLSYALEEAILYFMTFGFLTNPVRMNWATVCKSPLWMTRKEWLFHDFHCKVACLGKWRGMPCLQAGSLGSNSLPSAFTTWPESSLPVPSLGVSPVFVLRFHACFGLWPFWSLAGGCFWEYHLKD